MQMRTELPLRQERTTRRRPQVKESLCDSAVRARRERQRLEDDGEPTQHFARLGRWAAAVSHEIRNPLAAIVLQMDLLEETLEERSQDSAREVTESLHEIRTLLGCIEEIAEDSLMLASARALPRHVHDLGAAVQGWTAAMHQWTAARGVTIQLEGIEALGPVALHERTLRRAVHNLLQNAVAAMPQGGMVTIRGQRTASHVRLEISDTGLGMAPDQLPLIFRPFYTTKAHGTGLGLYLVQEIVGAHGGDIAVQSVSGQGTTFTITLPCTEVTETPSEASGTMEDTPSHCGIILGINTKEACGTRL